jgi:recombination protein RecR
VGSKTALRLVHHLLKGQKEDTRRLSRALVDLADNVRKCEVCGNFSEHEMCEICTNPRRDRSVLCVVEEAYEVGAIERTGQFRGLFHVLGGRLSPLDGIGPEELNVTSLLGRIDAAVGPRVTRLARGIPVGSDLEYVDGTTIAQALAGRREM